MSDNLIAEGPPAVDNAHQPMRRMLLAAIGGTIGLAACSAQTSNTEKPSVKKEETETEEVFNSWNRQRVFVNKEMTGTPWVAPQTGNFDLTDPVQNNLAVLKMTNNLVGKRTYVPMLVRMLIGRENEPGGVLLGAAAMFTWQLQVPDPEEFPNVPEGTALMRSMYTAVYLDPETMEPVSHLKNPYNGKMMELEDFNFVENFLNFPKGGSRFVEELQFSDDNPDEVKMRLIKPWDDDLLLYSGGVYSKPGVHQPRFTEFRWNANRDDVMNPDRAAIDSNYQFLGVKKAYEKPWSGYTTADGETLHSMATGKKVHSAEDLPDFHKRVLAEKYPDRL